jgi:hypothetical protein
MAGKHQGLENKHQRLLELAKTEPLQAAIEARDDLKASKKGRTYMSSIRQLDRIINGDESAWHYGARDQTEAVQFIITNLMLKSAGLGVIPSNVRNESNIARMVGNLITEDVDFAPMTTAQKRLKMIAESYGFQVYTLNEMDDQESVSPNRKGVTRLDRFKKSVIDRGWEGEIIENTPYSVDQRTGWQIVAKVRKSTARGIVRLSSHGWDGWTDSPLRKQTYIQLGTLDDVLANIGKNAMESRTNNWRKHTLNEAFDSSGMIFQYRINQKPVDLDEGSRERLSVAPDYDDADEDEYEDEDGDEDNYEDRANGLCDFDEAISILVASEVFADEDDAYETLEEAFWTVFADADGDPEVGWEENGQMHVLSPYKFDTEGF